MNDETTTWWVRKYNKPNLLANFLVSVINIVEKVYGYIKIIKKAKRNS